MSIKILDVVKPNKEKVLDGIRSIKYKIAGPLNAFLYANVLLYFLYFVNKIFF